MIGRTSDWKDELGRWLKPFLDRFNAIDPTATLALHRSDLRLRPSPAPSSVLV